MGKDADEEMGDDGHDGQQNTWIYVSGVAAAALVVLLVYAVMDTAESSQQRDAPVTYAPAISTTPTTTSRTSTKTTTRSPQISTTDMNPTSGPPPSPSETAGELTTPSETDSSTPTTTVTMTNPYATTSPPNAGHT